MRAVVKLGAGAAALAMAGTSLAIEPAYIQAGPVYIAPTLDVEGRYVDNLFRTNRQEKSSWVAELAPRVQAWLQNGANTYSLAYQLTDTSYASSHNDDFTDHLVNLDLHHEFTTKNKANLFAEFYDGHEERGVNLTEGIISRLIDKPVEFERSTLGGDYTYGNRDSDGRLKLAAKTVNYEYQNFRDFTQFRDRDEASYVGTFSWKVGARTDVLAEVRAIINEYEVTDVNDAAGSFDSDEMNYFLGVAWDATATTSGSVRLGMYERKFDSASRRDQDGFSWEAAINYKPRTYSSFDFGTRRFSRETNGLGDYVDAEEYTFDWNHNWNTRSSTHLGVLYAQDDYSGSRREDERSTAEASYNFAMKRWFDVGLGYRYENRDSNAFSLDYSQNMFFIKAELSL